MKSSTERVRRYRQRKKAELGDRKYKEMNRKHQREYRETLKQTKLERLAEQDRKSIETITEQLQDLIIDTWQEFKSNPILLRQQKQDIREKIADIRAFSNCDQLVDMIIEVERRNGREIKNSTIRTNIRIIDLIYRRMGLGRTFPCNSKSFEPFQDADRVIDFIKNHRAWKSPSTKISKLTALAGILRSMDGYEEAQLKYSELAGQMQTTNQQEREEQKLNPKQSANILPWPTIVAGLDTIDDLFDRAIYGMYTLIPPRRVSTFHDLKIQSLNYKMPTDFSYARDEGQNVLFLDRKLMPVKMILQRYKTAKKLGDYEAKVPPKLARVLHEYIKDEFSNGDMSLGDYLFPKLQSFDKYSKGGFQSLVASIFKKYLRRNIGSTFLRISFASHIINQTPQPSVRELKVIARKLGHTASQMRLYSKTSLYDQTDDF